MIVIQELVRDKTPTPAHIHNYVCMQQDLHYNVWEEKFYLDEFQSHFCIPLNPTLLDANFHTAANYPIGATST